MANVLTRTTLALSRNIDASSILIFYKNVVIYYGAEWYVTSSGHFASVPFFSALGQHGWLVFVSKRPLFLSPPERDGEPLLHAKETMA